MSDLLPTVQAYVLEYLVLKRRAHGYAMLTELRGVIGKSSVYDALYRLEGKGFVRSSRDTSVSGPRARRTFEITGLGEKALDRHRTAMFRMSGPPLAGLAHEEA